MQLIEQNPKLQQYQDRCVERLTWAINDLGGTVDHVQLSKAAELIIHTMTGPWRYFHTPEHIFEVGEKGDAVEVLAALFHDLVYVQVDQGVSVNISRNISAFVKEIDSQLVVRDRAELPQAPTYPLFEMVSQIFGFAPGRVLQPTAGQNEFLSALIATKVLEPALPPQALAQVAACIEATIPFRGKSENGQTACDRLYDRLVLTNQQFNLGWSATQIHEVVKRSVRLANRDVENFAYPCSADFLDNTWNLLPETNHDLKNVNSYTVHGYRLSLQKMEGFMHFLRPELVFQHYHNEPDEATYQGLITRTGRNLAVARLYLGSKLLSIAVIEALSRRIGHDIPLATMMGELPFLDSSVAQLENFLPNISVKYPPVNDLEWEVLMLLEKGRSQASSYDLKNSPVATFIIKSIGFESARHLLVHAKEFFKGVLHAEEFLDLCDRAVVEEITEAVLQVFESRKKAMRRARIETHV